MFAKYLTAGLAGSALLATVAFAQTPTATTDRALAPAAASDSLSFQGDWRTSKVVGLNVYNDNNESVGSINDLLDRQERKHQGGGDRRRRLPRRRRASGGGAVRQDQVRQRAGRLYRRCRRAECRRQYASHDAIDDHHGTTANGATGTSPATAAKPNPWYPDHAVFNATKDELKAMPEFKYSTE